MALIENRALESGIEQTPDRSPISLTSVPQHLWAEGEGPEPRRGAPPSHRGGVPHFRRLNQKIRRARQQICWSGRARARSRRWSSRAGGRSRSAARRPAGTVTGRLGGLNLPNGDKATPASTPEGPELGKNPMCRETAQGSRVAPMRGVRPIPRTCRLPLADEKGKKDSEERPRSWSPSKRAGGTSRLGIGFFQRVQGVGCTGMQVLTPNRAVRAATDQV